MLNLLFAKSVSLLDVVLADTAPSFMASDCYLPTLDGLKVDENVNGCLLSSLAELVSLLSVLLC